MKKVIKVFWIITGLIFVSIIVYFALNFIYFKPVTNETLNALRDGTPQEVEKAIKRIKINKLVALGVPTNGGIDRINMSPLCIASAHNKNPKVIEFLIDKGADTNRVFIYRGLETFPLNCAIVSNPNPEVIKTLLKYTDFAKIAKNMDEPYVHTRLGFDLKYKPKNKYSQPYISGFIVQDARFNKNPFVLDALLKDDRIKNNLTDGDIWFTYKFCSTNKWGADPEELVKVLINNGLDINIKYKFKNWNRSKTVLEDLQDSYKRAIERNNRENIILYKNAIDIIKKYSK